MLMTVIFVGCSEKKSQSTAQIETMNQDPVVPPVLQQNIIRRKAWTTPQEAPRTRLSETLGDKQEDDDGLEEIPEEETALARDPAL